MGTTVAEECSIQNRLVTVYIPTFNRLKLLKRAITSVLTQDYEHIELIVVNDGSTDGTDLYLDDLAKREKKVRVFHNDRSLGACHSRNIAIKNANGYFVTGLDDDDFFLQSRISDFVQDWRDSCDVIGLYSSHSVILNNGRIRSIIRPRTANFEDHFLQNRVGNQVFSTKKIYLDSGLFDTELRVFQDFELWYRFLALGTMKRVDNFSYVFDHSHDSERITKGSVDSINNSVNHIIRKHNLNKRNELRINLYRMTYTNDYSILRAAVKAIALLDLKSVLKILKLVVKRAFKV